MEGGLKFSEDLNLANYFLYDRLKEKREEHPAILFGEYSYTYKDIAKATDGLRRYFQEVGLRREERVLILLPDVPPFAWSLMATYADCLLYTSPSPRDATLSRMPSSA